jgi:hypothetical protein
MMHIDELVIRVPHMSKEQSIQLGNEMAQLVAEGLPDGMRNYPIPELNIKMTAPQLNGSVSMASSIAEQIVQQIKLATL